MYCPTMSFKSNLQYTSCRFHQIIIVRAHDLKLSHNVIYIIKLPNQQQRKLFSQSFKRIITHTVVWLFSWKEHDVEIRTLLGPISSFDWNDWPIICVLLSCLCVYSTDELTWCCIFYVGMVMLMRVFPLMSVGVDVSVFDVFIMALRGLVFLVQAHYLR